MNDQTVAVIMQRALDTLLDVQAELEQPEVAELTTLRLDAKIVSTIRDLRAALGEEPYEPQE